MSSAIEDYAKAIYALEERAGDPVSTNALAERIGVTPASASGMVKRLGELGLVEHEPYHGVSLTERGRRVALEVMRHHRLLELYLVESLGVPWDRVHKEAEVLEHVLSEELEELIAAKLGRSDPRPARRPDPDPRADDRGRAAVRLQALKAGDRGTFTRVSDSDPDMLRYLADRGIAPGAEFEVVDKQPFDGPLFVRFDDHVHVLGGALARAMRVEVRRDAAAPPPIGAAGARGRRGRRPGVARSPYASPLERLLARGRLRATLAMLGPAFVASVAYVDPGNFATNIQGGAKFGYLLLWVVLAANLMAMLIQYLSAKLGIVTDRSLPGAVPRALPALGDLGPLDPGRGDGDVDRHRRVPRRGARAEPAVRRSAPARPERSRA